MNEPLVSIVIPTCNRADLLRIALQSVVDQSYENVQIIVLDNASSDNTAKVVASFANQKINYLRQDTNIGLYQNWCQALNHVESPYFSILQDDDLLQPHFVSSTVSQLECHKDCALAYSSVETIDIDGELLESPVSDDRGPQMIMGLDYLERIVAGENVVLHVSSCMYRTRYIRKLGNFDVLHQRHAIEFHFQFRLASRYNLVEIFEPLVQVRQHADQDHRNNMSRTGPIGMTSDRIDAISYLLESHRAEDSDYRMWLATRQRHINTLRSNYTTNLLPDLNLDAEERFELAAQEISTFVSHGKPFVLIDEYTLAERLAPEFQSVPFMQQDGCYTGPPVDSNAAIEAIETLRLQGVEKLVFVWPAFWWFDFYIDFREYLTKHYSCVANNSRLIMFDLASLAEDNVNAARGA